MTKQRVKRISHPKISKQWLFKHYIDLNWTAQMCAEKRNVELSYIYDLVIDYSLQKWKFKKHKVWNIPRMKAAHKRTIRESQPNKKAVVVYAKGEDVAKHVFGSISLAAKKLKTNRENIRACLQGKRKHANGYRFEFLEDIKPTTEAITLETIRQNIEQEDEYNRLSSKIKYA